MPLEEDCFYKMQEYFKAKSGLKANMAVLHSRYSSQKGTIKDSLAHPHKDLKARVAIFHNGFIANYEDLNKELIKSEGGSGAESDS